MAYADAPIRPTALPSAGPQELYELGLKYATGSGAPLDLIAAHKWFNLAALRGWGPAKEQRSEIAEFLSPADVRKALAAARNWLTANTV